MVRAVKYGGKGQIWSAWSNPVFFTYNTSAYKPVKPVTEKDSIRLSVQSFKDGMPKLKWSKYIQKSFDGYALFVRESAWAKDGVISGEVWYFSKNTTNYQFLGLKENTQYTFRVVPYKQVYADKVMLYPASNALVITTGVSS